MYDKNRDRSGTGTKPVKTASFFIKTGFSFVKNSLQSRLRPGSARSRSGNAVEKENDVRSYEDTEEKEHSPSFAKEVSKYEVDEQVDYFLNEYKVAKNHKDLLLRAIFKEKEDFLSLYNALNGTNYTDAEKLEITTLENAVYMSVQNDVSFVFLSELYMIEHQSTVNPNMPLRNLTYISNVLSKITAKEDIYGSKQIKLPTPRFIVLYNGTKQTEEKTVLKLSDAYEKKMVEPELELITTVLNINEGYNEKLKSACKLLRDYMTLITKIREKQKTMDLQQATYQAIAECIREDVLKDFLMKHRAEVIAMMLYDFDMEKHIESEKAYEYERGREDMEKDMEKTLVSRWWKKGKNIEEIVEDLGKPEQYVKTLLGNL